MERLSALDAEFLHLEDGCAHLHIAGLSVFDGPPPSLDDLAGLLAAKLHLIPRYRQRVRFLPLELGRPVWEDDPHFDLRYHVCHTALPSPGDDAAVCRLMGRLMSQPLNRDRPLWEAWIVEDLPGGRWGLVSKVHHCMVDGIAGVELLEILLAASPDEPVPEPDVWAPAPARPGPALVLDAWGGLAGDVAALARRTPNVVRDPRGALRGATDTVAGLLQFGRRIAPTPPLSIEGPIGPNRSWAHASASIADVRSIRRVFGGTLNDVVLAAIAGGYRSLLIKRGDDVSSSVVRSLVPVSVRGDDGHGVPDNRVSAVLYELPVQIPDPLERLAHVREAMAELKGSHMVEAGVTLTTIGNLTPPVVLGVATRLGWGIMRRFSQRTVNTVTTNVPGPQFPLFCLGREMLEYFPFVPIGHGARVDTAVLSYNGRLGFGVTGDLDTVPEVGVVADTIESDIAELIQHAERASPERTTDT